MRTTSSYYCIGAKHIRCEDYALHWDDGVVVSDGCSGAEHADVGARLICWEVRQSSPLKKGWLPYGSRQATQLLGLPDISLYASTMVITDDQNTFNVQVAGDGVVAARRHDGSYRITRLHFLNSCPQYAAKNFPGVDPYSCEFEQFVDVYDPDLVSTTVNDTQIDAFSRFTYNKDEFDLVAVFSDGVESFRTVTSEGWDVSNKMFTDFVADFMSVRNHNGNFMERRARRVLHDLSRRGIYHTDDFSVGALYDGSLS